MYKHLKVKETRSFTMRKTRRILGRNDLEGPTFGEWTLAHPAHPLNAIVVRSRKRGEGDVPTVSLAPVTVEASGTDGRTRMG